MILLIADLYTFSFYPSNKFEVIIDFITKRIQNIFKIDYISIPS